LAANQICLIPLRPTIILVRYPAHLGFADFSVARRDFIYYCVFFNLRTQIMGQFDLLNSREIMHTKASTVLYNNPVQWWRHFVVRKRAFCLLIDTLNQNPDNNQREGIENTRRITFSWQDVCVTWTLIIN